MQSDPSPGWLQSALTLLGVGGVGAALLKLVERIFARADKREDDAVKFRSELRAEIRDLNERNDLLTARLDVAQERNHVLQAALTESRAESIALRNRYHRLKGYVSEALLIQEQYANRLGIAQHERLRIPAWVDETIPGPTASAALPPLPPTEPDPTPQES